MKRLLLRIIFPAKTCVPAYRLIGKSWHRLIIALAYCLIITLFASCQKTNDFYEMLNGLPQISNQTNYKYRSAYAVGDTLVITGVLNPGKDLKIKIGDTYADILRIDTVYYNMGNNKYGVMQQASIEITEEMGVGNDRPVIVYNGNDFVRGAAISIYSKGGEGSFEEPLRFITLLASLGRQNVYLHCINGQGDIYFYDFLENSLVHYGKGGELTTLLTTEELCKDQNGAFAIERLIAGGVNPQGTLAYLSLQTKSDYRFCTVDLVNKTVTTLTSTTSADIRSPYEGKLSELKAVFSGVFPDAEHTVYLYVGSSSLYAGQNAMAVAEYNTDSGQLKYLFKVKANANSDMPGILLNDSYLTEDMRIYPQEKVMYWFFNNIGTDYNTIRTITRYSLSSRIVVNQFVSQTISGSSNIGLFSGVSFNINDGWGYMPMSGQRLETLYNVNNTSAYSKSKDYQWMVIDFRNERTYQNAPGYFTFGDYFIGPTVSGSTRIDELLNYDKDGNIYMTANNRSLIVRTEPVTTK